MMHTLPSLNFLLLLSLSSAVLLPTLPGSHGPAFAMARATPDPGLWNWAKSLGSSSSSSSEPSSTSSSLPSSTATKVAGISMSTQTDSTSRFSSGTSDPTLSERKSTPYSWSKSTSSSTIPDRLFTPYAPSTSSGSSTSTSTGSSSSWDKYTPTSRSASTQTQSTPSSWSTPTPYSWDRSNGISSSRGKYTPTSRSASTQTQSTPSSWSTPTPYSWDRSNGISSSRGKYTPTSRSASTQTQSTPSSWSTPTPYSWSKSNGISSSTQTETKSDSSLFPSLWTSALSSAGSSTTPDYTYPQTNVLGTSTGTKMEDNSPVFISHHGTTSLMEFFTDNRIQRVMCYLLRRYESMYYHRRESLRESMTEESWSFVGSCPEVSNPGRLRGGWQLSGEAWEHSRTLISYRMEIRLDYSGVDTSYDINNDIANTQLLSYVGTFLGLDPNANMVDREGSRSIPRLIKKLDLGSLTSNQMKQASRAYLVTRWARAAYQIRAILLKFQSQGSSSLMIPYLVGSDVYHVSRGDRRTNIRSLRMTSISDGLVSTWSALERGWGSSSSVQMDLYNKHIGFLVTHYAKIIGMAPEDFINARFPDISLLVTIPLVQFAKQAASMDYNLIHWV
ncbi:hypothetical protein BJ684DRAFT_14747 [Piptocephalis cylindrospora]|uniref:Uncharacterized protein n=1 Tax=Piptocephalis cylindrospora TaxID=1907219 RepID=A0A4P9YA86_9FUNG|nr:hypothetical protein BJ684DRAFT_14747 [Piptocephalis cylindrospora]|eukprot:RKP14970.1 hypothetical protein BJ684DRAFT_14747 [Piptocephalis cylindrospora]